MNTTIEKAKQDFLDHIRSAIPNNPPICNSLCEFVNKRVPDYFSLLPLLLLVNIIQNLVMAKADWSGILLWR